VRVLVIGGIASSLVNFRGPLLQAMVSEGHEAFACAGEVDDAGAVLDLESMGVRFHEASLRRRGTNVWSDWQYYRSLVGIMDSCRPQVVLAYTVKPVIYGCLAAARTGVPLVAAMITGAGVVREESGEGGGAAGTAARLLYRRSLRHAHLVFFQNRDDEHLFRERRLLGAERVVQVPGSGVDLERFPFAPPVLRPLTFLLVARLLPAKGVREFAEASRCLKERYGEQVRCLLVGPFEHGAGGIRPEEVSEWQASGALEYRGEVLDVRPHLGEASVFVLPSYYGEGRPRTVLEAMAMGRAVITADTPGCRDTIQDGVSGLLVPPRDPGALAAAMERFVLDPELIARMGLRGRERAEACFDVRHVNRIVMRELGLSRTRAMADA
jgi:glycosyltransferase involved in cell wall biosynthesis